jgi:hypothetical protein
MSLRLGGIAAACACLLAAFSPARAEPPRPLLWRVSDGDNSVYLLGTIHVLRAEDYPTAPEVDAALADAERVVLELSPAEMADPGLPARMLGYARRGDSRSLQQALAPATWKALEAYAASRGLQPAALQQYDAWYVGLLVTLIELQRMGLDPELGLDRHIAGRAQAAGKTTAGLETAEEQFRVLDAMTVEEQRQMLEEGLRDPQVLQREIADLHRLWRSGDASGLYEEMASDFRRDYPDLFQAINVERNRAWLPRVEALLRESGEDDAMVVVGSLHLLGPEGLVELLRGRGYRVERIAAD